MSKRNTLALILLTCLVVPFQDAASGQQIRAARLATHLCYPEITDNGWETLCAVSVLEAGRSTLIANGVFATWSPDGLRIAYTDGAVSYIKERATRNTVAVLDGFDSLSWSSDGARIAGIGWVNDGSGSTPELFTIDPNNLALIRLTNAVGFGGAYAWSPSGNAIAFGRADAGVQELYVMNADGSNPIRLTSGSGFAGAISWSPDGGRIAFDCGTTICAVNRDGTNLVALTSSPEHSSTAVFSSSGQLAFLQGSPGYGELLVQDPDGSLRQVAPGITATKPQWSPDGGSLAFVMEGVGGGACEADGRPCAPPDAILVVNADGSALRTIGSGSYVKWFVPQPGQPAAAFTHGCSGRACDFDAAGSFDPDGTIASYEWRFGDGTTASGPAAAHSYDVAGSYDVTLTVTDNTGARDVTEMRVIANTAPTASFVATCDGPTCTFDGSASSDPEGAVAEYRWSFGYGSERVSYTFPTGTFTVSLVVLDGTGVESAPVHQTVSVVNPAPIASFTVTCTDLKCAVDASSSSDPDGSSLSFRWSFGDGSNYATDGPTGVHTYSNPGIYTITLTVTDAVGQNSTASHAVTVNSPPPPPVHIGDLDGATYNNPKSWNAFATVAVHTGAHGAAGGVTVTGKWNDGTVASCTTDSGGRCTIGKYEIPRKTTAVTFTVTSAAGTQFVYDAAANHDGDGDSTGTAITIKRP